MNKPLDSFIPINLANVTRLFYFQQLVVDRKRANLFELIQISLFQTTISYEQCFKINNNTSDENCNFYVIRIH